MPISTIGSNSLNQTSDLTINGVTVGEGGGSVSTNTAVGASALAANTTGASNTAIGSSALQANTTASNNTAVGYQAGIANTTGRITAFGHRVLYGNTTGTGNTGVGGNDGSVGSALLSNTTGSYNIAVGTGSLQNNTTASNNTAVGYQAGYTNTTGQQNTFIGHQSGYNTNNATGYNTFVGRTSGYNNTTGYQNTFFGGDAGYYVTTGNKNTILGMYNGNQGGLDIRTSSNRIVLSDGDGNPFVYAYDGYFSQSTNSGGRYVQYSFALASVEKATIFWDNTNTNLYVRCASGGVYLTNTGTSWTSNSDERLKENLVPITNALTKVNTLRAVIGNFISDETKKKTPFLIAQDVQAVLPEAISTTMVKDDETNTEYLGVAYTEVIPLLVASIKELKTIVDAQAAEIAELKAKVA